MKKGFTIVEVSILLVIFLIVAILVVPISLDDTKQAQNISRWRSVQQDFTNIFYSVDTHKKDSDLPFKAALEAILNNETKSKIKPYKITYMNGLYPIELYRFEEYKSTFSNATIALKIFDKPKDDFQGLLMYDVNGKEQPNAWGKDVFGLKIYSDRFEPIGKEVSISKQKEDCSKNGTGLYCSNYYIIGGNFD